MGRTYCSDTAMQKMIRRASELPRVWITVTVSHVFIGPLGVTVSISNVAISSYTEGTYQSATPSGPMAELLSGPPHAVARSQYGLLRWQHTPYVRSAAK